MDLSMWQNTPRNASVTFIPYDYAKNVSARKQINNLNGYSRVTAPVLANYARRRMSPKLIFTTKVNYVFDCSDGFQSTDKATVTYESTSGSSGTSDRLLPFHVQFEYFSVVCDMWWTSWFTYFRMPCHSTMARPPTHAHTLTNRWWVVCLRKMKLYTKIVGEERFFLWRIIMQTKIALAVHRGTANPNTNALSQWTTW